MAIKASKCPNCGRILYNRKIRNCVYCNVALPENLLLSQSQVEKLEKTTAEMQKRHTAFLKNHQVFMESIVARLEDDDGREVEVRDYNDVVDRRLKSVVLGTLVGLVMIALTRAIPQIPSAVFALIAGGILVCVLIRRYGVKRAIIGILSAGGLWCLEHFLDPW